MEKYGVNTAYDEGYKAQQAGVPPHKCPYDRGTEDNKNWTDGWWDAADAEAS